MAADLFGDDTPAATPDNGAAGPAPLAERLRPNSLAEVVGQEHLTGPDGAIGRMVAAGQLSSIILWGPPGTGKTTIARLHEIGRASGRGGWVCAGEARGEPYIIKK